MNDNVFSSYSSCYKCEKRIKIEYYEDTCETKDNVTFMGDLGMEIYSYCPYCGVKHTGFRPYDLQTERNAAIEDDDEEEWDADDDSWWPDAEGVTLVDDDENEDQFVALETELGKSVADHTGHEGLQSGGQPHLANLLVQDGYADSKETAMHNYLNKLRIRMDFLGPEEAIAGILAGGGIPVLAHPTYGNGDQLIQGENMDRRLQRLMAYGLQGVEGFYSGFSPAIRKEILDFAERYHLYVTAGSDYHGKNKLIHLGDTGLTPETVFPEGLHRFLEAIEA